MRSFQRTTSTCVFFFFGFGIGKGFSWFLSSAVFVPIPSYDEFILGYGAHIFMLITNYATMTSLLNVAKEHTSIPIRITVKWI